MADEKGNLTSKAYDTLKKMILTGALKQGQAISITVMAEELNISRSPVSSACQRLEHEKFVTIIPKQGVVVNTISIETACGIYELRVAIETYNAKKVLDIITDSDIQILKHSIQMQLKAIEDNDSKTFMEEDIFFHKFILEKNTNCELISVTNQLYDRAFMLGMRNGVTSRMTEAVNEHINIVEALEKRNKKDFLFFIEENILNGLRFSLSI